MTQADLRAAVRRMIGNPSLDRVPNAWIDEQLDAAMQAANRVIHFAYTDDTSITTESGTGEYTLPVDCTEILWVQYDADFLDRSSQEEWRNRGIDWRGETAGTPTEFAHYGTKLILYPKPDAAETVTVRYVSTPATIGQSGPAGLPTQDHRVLTYYAAAMLQLAHPDKDVPGSPDSLLSLFDREVEKIAAQFQKRGLKL